MITLGALVLDENMQWTDEFAWLPTAHQVEPASNGSLIVEESKLLAGRPITLSGGRDPDGRWWGVNTRATVNAARALAADVLAAPLLLTLEDGRTFDVRFRLAELAVEATPVRHVVTDEDTDYYLLTLRLMQV